MGFFKDLKNYIERKRIEFGISRVYNSLAADESMNVPFLDSDVHTIPRKTDGGCAFSEAYRRRLIE